MIIYLTLLYGLVFIFVLLIFSNLVLPLFINKPLFFMFRKGEKKLFKTAENLIDARVGQQADRLEKEVNKIEKKSAIDTKERAKKQTKKPSIKE